MIDDGWGHGNSNNVLCQQLWCQKWQQSNSSAHVVNDNTNVFSQRQRQRGQRCNTLHNIRLWQELLRTCPRQEELAPNHRQYARDFPELDHLQR